MTTRDRIAAILDATRGVLRNRITIGFLVLSSLYWFASPWLEPEWRDYGILMLRSGIIAGSVLAAATYFLSALKSVRRGEHSNVTEWLVGVVTFFAAVATGSIYSIIWIRLGRPEWMTAHPALGFILLWQLIGVCMIVKAPHSGSEDGSGNRSRLLLAIGIAVVAAISFTAGRVTKTEGAMAPLFAANKPWCPSHLPVIGNVNSRGAKIYHLADSPYLQMVMPDACFATEAEAIAAGFRKAG